MTITTAPPSRLQWLLEQRDNLNRAIAQEIHRSQVAGRHAATGGRRVATRKEWSDQLAIAAAIHYGLDIETILGPGSKAHVCEARNCAFWMLRKAGRSLHEIGRMFGCHHTTVLHGARRVEQQDEQLRTARLIYKSMTECDE